MKYTICNDQKDKDGNYCLNNKLSPNYENDMFGKPSIKLTGTALKKFNHLSHNKGSIVVSLSDEKNYAIANVIIFERNEVF